jgi:hypothetical protein
MSAAARAERAIDSYLRQLRAALGALPAAQVDDIIREIRSHLIDSAAGDNGSDPRRVTDAIVRLGDPARLANAYLMESLALRAQSTHSPLLLLRLVSRWAARSLEGLVALVLAFFGYAIALIGVGCALFKPFIPERIGLWVRQVPPDDWSYQLGRVSAPPTDARELLGWYMIPLGLVIGGVAFAATTRFLLAKVRSYRSSRDQLGVLPTDRV